MAENVHQKLKTRLETLKQRLNDAVRRFDERGELTKDHESFAQALHQRHDELREKLDSAAHDGHTWDTLKYEFELDVNELIEEFDSWEKKLDARSMKSNKAKRSN
jgi:chromosome segregation ATPase